MASLKNTTYSTKCLKILNSFTIFRHFTDGFFMIQGFYVFVICCTDRESRELLAGMTYLKKRLKIEMYSPQSSVIQRGNISGNIVLNQDEYEVEGEYTISVMNSKDA